MSLENPIKVKISDSFDRSKLSLGSEARTQWIDNSDQMMPRNGLLYKREIYRVEGNDPVVQHFLDGGTLERVDESKTSFEDKLDKLPYIGEERAEEIKEDFDSWEDFKEADLIDYLSDMEGIGHKRAEQIIEEVE